MTPNKDFTTRWPKPLRLLFWYGLVPIPLCYSVFYLSTCLIFGTGLVLALVLSGEIAVLLTDLFVLRVFLMIAFFAAINATAAVFLSLLDAVLEQNRAGGVGLAVIAQMVLPVLAAAIVSSLMEGARF